MLGGLVIPFVAVGAATVCLLYFPRIPVGGINICLVALLANLAVAVAVCAATNSTSPIASSGRGVGGEPERSFA